MLEESKSVQKLSLTIVNEDISCLSQSCNCSKILVNPGRGEDVDNISSLQNLTGPPSYLRVAPVATVRQQAVSPADSIATSEDPAATPGNSP